MTEVEASSLGGGPSWPRLRKPGTCAGSTAQVRCAAGCCCTGPPGCGKTFIARAVGGASSARAVHRGVVRRHHRHVRRAERAETSTSCSRSPGGNAPCVLFPRRGGRDRAEAFPAAEHPDCAARSTSCCSSLDDISGDKRRCVPAGGHPTTRGTWTARCAVPAGSTGPCSLLPPPDARRRGEGVFRYHLKDRPVAGNRPGQAWPGRPNGLLGRRHRATSARRRPSGALMDSVPHRRAADDRPR